MLFSSIVPEGGIAGIPALLSGENVTFGVFIDGHVWVKLAEILASSWRWVEQDWPMMDGRCKSR